MEILNSYHQGRRLLFLLFLSTVNSKGIVSRVVSIIPIKPWGPDRNKLDKSDKFLILNLKSGGLVAMMRTVRLDLPSVINEN